MATFHAAWGVDLEAAVRVCDCSQHEAEHASSTRPAQSWLRSASRQMHSEQRLARETNGCGSARDKKHAAAGQPGREARRGTKASRSKSCITSPPKPKKPIRAPRRMPHARSTNTPKYSAMATVWDDGGDRGGNNSLMRSPLACIVRGSAAIFLGVGIGAIVIYAQSPGAPKPSLLLSSAALPYEQSQSHRIGEPKVFSTAPRTQPPQQPPSPQVLPPPLRALPPPLSLPEPVGSLSIMSPAPSPPPPPPPPLQPALSPPPPPVRMPPARSSPAADSINARFELGRASSDLRRAGLLIHMSDNLEDGSEPWLPCRSGWCTGLDHMSSSIVNAGCGSLYWNRVKEARWGFVLSPDVGLACSYSGDGGSQGQVLGGCGTKAECSRDVFWNCAWPPGETESMLRFQACGNYNEAIVASPSWESLMPRTIEAVIFASGAARPRASAVHRQFLQRYRRTAMEAPLLQLSWGSSHRPFRDASWDDEG